MYISRIKIKKFRHLEDEELGPFTFNHKSSDLIAFAGPNGSGKSSVLELISYALSSSYSLSWVLSRTFSDFSFEIGLGLNPDERSILIDAQKEQLVVGEEKLQEQVQDILKSPDSDDSQKKEAVEVAKERHESQYSRQYELIHYLENNEVYYRAFNFEEGEYAKNTPLHNQLHQFATSQLKDLLKRSLGFFLKSDRHYPKKTFSRNKIFDYVNQNKKEHLWTLAFNTSELQYQDMYDFLVQQRYHYLRDLGNYHHKIATGSDAGLIPEDPLIPYQELLNSLFPDYDFADKDEDVPTNLFIKIPSGEIIPFDDLSSGEKEVFFILSFFIRHNVENAIIVIDEPEIHLHPELSRLLIRSMKSIRLGNQIWVATHNSEIIDEAGRDKVIYVARDPETRKAKFTQGPDEEQVVSQLRNLFGYSGYIGVAKNLVFIEGTNSSQDRKYFGSLFPIESRGMKLIPVSGSQNLAKINNAVLAILESNLGWINFFLIRDRDYLTPEMIDKYQNHSPGKIFVLKKHEIENYLLNFDAISDVVEDIFGISKSSDDIRSLAYKSALRISSDVVRDMAAFRLNLILSPNDFSLGKMLEGNKYFDNNNDIVTMDEGVAGIMRVKFEEKGQLINDSLLDSFSQESILGILTNCENEVKAALESDAWISLFPGKELLSLIAKELGITNLVSLQNSIIKHLGANQELIEDEIKDIILAISQIGMGD